MTHNGAFNIYQTQPCEGCEWVIPVDTSFYDQLPVHGKPIADPRRPIKMRRLRVIDGQTRRPCDFPAGSAGGCLIMNEAAIEKIGSLLKRYGEFLPVETDGGKFWALFVTHFIDALDEAASQVHRAPDDPSYIMSVQKHAFRPERLTPDLMFKLPQSRGRGEIYVTDPFVKMINASGLTGLRFKKIWPHT